MRLVAVGVVPPVVALRTAATYREATMAVEGIRDSLKKIFNGLSEVQVVTIVQDLPVTVETIDLRTKATFATAGGPVPALITVFNLIDGDVTNVIAPSLKDDADLRAFHTAQVDRSLAVLPANIEALVKLGKAIREELT